MSERQIGQLSFADEVVAAAAGGNEVLERVSALIDWKPVETLLKQVRGGRMGAPAYPALMMFKALLLQRWYGLSDPALEEALKDRLSFRRFVNLPLSEAIPDHATLWRFREALDRKLCGPNQKNGGSGRSPPPPSWPPCCPAPLGLMGSFGLRSVSIVPFLILITEFAVRSFRTLRLDFLFFQIGLE